MTSQPDPSHSTDAVRGLLGHLITPAARTPSPTTTQTATAAYLSMRQQYGEQIALQMLFDQYGAALASMPSEMAGMLQMYGVDATAVIRAVQEFAVQTIANVLACAEQRMQGMCVGGCGFVCTCHQTQHIDTHKHSTRCSHDVANWIPNAAGSYGESITGSLEHAPLAPRTAR